MNEALENIHLERSSKDPIYCLLFNPSFVEKDQTLPFITRLTKLCVEYIETVYGEKLMCNRVVNRVCKLLKDLEDNPRVYNIKIFMILFTLNWEPELTDQIGVLYETSNDTIYTSNYFKLIMIRISTYIEQTLIFPYNKFNMITTANNFVMAVRKDYMMGPSKN